MKCEDVLLLISGHLDGENTLEEEQLLQAHLCSCEDCRNVLRAFEEVDAGLAELKESAPDGLRGDIMAQIKKETSKKKRRPWYGLAVAAALTLVIGVSAIMDLPEEECEPQTISNTETYALSRSVTVEDVQMPAQRIAEECGAAVVVIHELYYEIETYPCQTTDEGYLLYVLPDDDLASEMAENYGCQLYEPAGEVDQTVSYALLAP